jgi:hypothetical protein
VDEQEATFTWPERHTCHAREARLSKGEWRERDGQRVCDYCGSLHPADLLSLLKQGATLGGSDWKYGWPHKFYVTAPNPQADETVQVGSSFSAGVETPIMGKRPTLHFKWYNDHLRDDGYGPEARERLIAALAKHSHIEFSFDAEGRLMYRAPHFGYQRY